MIAILILLGFMAWGWFCFRLGVIWTQRVLDDEAQAFDNERLHDDIDTKLRYATKDEDDNER